MNWKIGSVILVILLVGGILLFAYRHSSCPLSESGLCVGPCPAFIDEDGDGLCDRADAATEPTIASDTTTPTPSCPFGRVNDPYPGQCNRYVDNNHNGICDLSEPGFVPEEKENDTPTPNEPMIASDTTTPTLSCPFGRVNDPYPGQCNRYVDNNHNGICDLSEPGFVPAEKETVIPTPTLLHQRRYQRHGWGGGMP